MNREGSLVLTDGAASRDGENKELKPLLLTVDEAARLLRMSRSFVYNLVMSGEIASIKLGRSRRVPAVELERFVSERLEAERDGVDFLPVGS